MSDMINSTKYLNIKVIMLGLEMDRMFPLIVVSEMGKCIFLTVKKEKL